MKDAPSQNTHKHAPAEITTWIVKANSQVAHDANSWVIMQVVRETVT